MRKILNTLVGVGFAFQACQSHVPEHLATEEVRAQIEVAYAFANRGQLSEADSVYNYILDHQVNAGDSTAISMSYVYVLLSLKDYQGAFEHIDRAFPAGQIDPFNELRRHSYRQQAFFGLNDCDGIKAEQAALLALVEEHDRLQLSLEEVVANGVVIAERCP